MGYSLSSEEFWAAHQVSDHSALPEFSDDVVDPLLRGVNTYRSYCYLSARGRQLLARVRSLKAAIAVAEAAWRGGGPVEVRLRDFSGQLVPRGKERLRIMQSLQDMEALAEEFYAVFEKYGEKPPLALWALRVSRPTWYNIHVETPLPMNRPGETSQDIAPQGLQPEFERRSELEGVALSTRARLLAAQKAAEEASLELREAESDHLEELEGVYETVISTFFKSEPAEAREKLKAGKRLLVRALDGSGASAFVVRWSTGQKEELLPWNEFATSAAEEIARVLETGDARVISYYGKPVALLRRPEDEEDFEYQSLRARVQ